MRRLANSTDSPPPRSGTAVVIAIGALAGFASAMNSHAASDRTPGAGGLVATAALFALAGAVGFVLLRLLLRKVARGAAGEGGGAALAGYAGGDHWPFAVFLLSFLGAFGVKFNLLTTGAMWVLFLGAQGWWLARCLGRERWRRATGARSTLAGLFFLSGIAALVYQVAWQRLLFTLFGVNIESVTLIVSVFMFGLGVGAMVGGWMSERYASRLPELFLWIEIGIAAFGFVSVPLIAAVGGAAAGGGPVATALVVYLVLFFPTLCMGATLPILVAYLHRQGGSVGSAVGVLYTFNTAGSALACFLTAGVLFRYLGLTGSVWFAAVCNLVTGWLVYCYCRGMARHRAAGSTS